MSSSCFYQISYIDDCDDVDELMGAEWVCHKEAWQLLWQLAESCVEHNRHKRPSSPTVSTMIHEWT
jgi:CRISPR/Cas system-associated endonuclease Cas1